MWSPAITGASRGCLLHLLLHPLSCSTKLHDYGQKKRPLVIVPECQPVDPLFAQQLGSASQSRNKPNTIAVLHSEAATLSPPPEAKAFFTMASI
eukprot:1159731-Pelagomonas_calceolata.AAC.8